MVHFICYMLRRLFCYACLVSSSGNWEVQCGQRVALMSISLMQKGHFLVVGAAGSSFLHRRMLLCSLPLAGRTG